MALKKIRFIKPDKSPIVGAEYKITQSGKSLGTGKTDGNGAIMPIADPIASKEVVIVQMKLPGKQVFIKTHEFKWSNDWPLSINLAYPGRFSTTIETQKNSGAPSVPNTYTRNIHVVKSGDTLGKIAQANGANVSELQALNGINNPNSIKVGQKIKLPPRSERKASTTEQAQSPPKPEQRVPTTQKPKETPKPSEGGVVTIPPILTEIMKKQQKQTAKIIQQNSKSKGTPVAIATSPGTWNIKVTAPDDRSKTTTANLLDENDKVVFSFTVLLRGSATNREDRSVTNANTPLGVYDIPRGNNQWMSGNRPAYGKNPRVVLNGERGEIKASGRTWIRIHGGRQEHWVNARTVKGADGKNKVIAAHWEPDNPVQLKPTNGCLRAYDADMVTLKKHIDKMNARNILSGKLFVTNILGQIEEKYKYTVKSKDGFANLRASPGGKILTTVQNGTEWKSDGVKLSGNWYLVSIGTKGKPNYYSGYVHNSSIEKVRI